MADEDLKALMSSQIFREFSYKMLKKKASDKDIWSSFFDMENKINKSAELKGKFKEVQNKLIKDSSYYNSVNKDFAEIVLMMDFEK